MYQTILLPLDGSPLGDHAIPAAVAIARRTDSVVHAVMVIDPVRFIPDMPGDARVFDSTMVRERRDVEERAFAERVERMREQGVRVEGHTLQGLVVETLLDHAQAVAAGLIVMSTHGRSGLTRLLAGSVATAIVAESAVPVLLVPAAAGHPCDFAAGGVVLCPLDGGAFAEAIVPHARRFAEAMDMGLSLLGVATPDSTPMAPFATGALLADPEEAARATSRTVADLERVVADCPPGTTFRAVNDMDPAEAILAEATRQGCGLIAMATHARGGVGRLLRGSVTDDVIRRSAVPMLLYRPSDSTEAPK